jgi:Carboxypeptidase regulatory-like domain
VGAGALPGWSGHYLRMPTPSFAFRLRARVRFAGRLAFLAAAALSFLAVTPEARGQVVGSIVGNVFDQSGAPITGVRISARSATQIGGDKVTYTNDEGFFRLPGLQPGVFEVQANAPKLKTVLQKDVHVGVNAPAEVNLMMDVVTGTEEVKVVEKAPIVSTTTATVKETFDSDFVDRLPMDKRTGYGGFIRDTVPGASNGGDWTARVRGGNSQQNGILVEGFHMANQKITLNSLAALEVQSAGYGAENAGYAGSVVNMVTKSGSNQYELDVGAFHEDSRLRPFLGNNERNPHLTNTFFNPAVSGPIIKDKLWFYFNVESRYQETHRGQDPAGLYPEPPILYYFNVRGTLKMTWQVSPRNKVQTFTLVNREYNQNHREGFDVTPEAQRMRDWYDYFTGITWESLLHDTLFFKSQIGYQRFLRTDKPEMCRTDPVACEHVVPIEQSFPRRLYFGNHDATNQLIDSGVEMVNTLEWFANTKRFGDHAVKLVSRYFHRFYETADGVPGDMKIFYNGLVPDRRREYFSNDPRLEGARRGYWLSSASGFRMVNSIQDAVRIGRKLTITPGVAFIINQAGNSQMGNVISQADLTPHLAVAWDPFGDGRTVLRGSFNQYLDTDAVRIARHALGSGVSRECRYNAATGEFDLECRYSGGQGGRTIGLPCGPNGVNADGSPCREELKTPRTWEWTMGGEREVAQGLGLGSDIIYRRYTNPYERRETNRIWNAAGSAVARGGAFRNGMPTTIDDLGTPGDAERRYFAITTSVKRREGELMMTASYTWSRLSGNVGGEEDNEFGNIAPRDPYLWGDLPNDRRHEVRASASYQINKWLSAGTNFSYFSGSPYSRRFRNDETGQFDDYRARIGVNPGSDINDPADDRPLRLPDITRLNMQLRANLKPFTGLNLDMYADFLNVLSMRTTTGVVTEDGPNFGSPTGQLEPFRTRIGMRFRY